MRNTMEKDCNLRLDLTSTALKGEDAPELVRRARALAAPHRITIGIQLHNTAELPEVGRLARLGAPLSFHAPVGGRFNMNFAAEDASLTFQMADEQAELMRRFGADRAVFHGFIMTDLPVPAFGHGKSYDECMKSVCRPELVRHEGSRFVSDFTGTAEFLERRERVKNNLKLLRARHPDILWCVENDFPGYGSGDLRGRDLAYLEHPVCLDTGHLWAASKMLDLDFYREIEVMLASGNVKMVHFHASRYTFDMDYDEWGDGHLPLDYPTAMDLKWIAQACKKANVPHFVLEIAPETLRNVERFIELYGGE